MKQILDDAEYDVRNVEVEDVEKDDRIQIKIKIKIIIIIRIRFSKSNGTAIETRFRDAAKNETLGIQSFDVELEGELQQQLSHSQHLSCILYGVMYFFCSYFVFCICCMLYLLSCCML